MAQAETFLKPLPKYPERGWLFPYLIEGDKIFSVGRWHWWTNCLLEEKIEGNIPQIVFRCSQGVVETIKHLEEIVSGIKHLGESSPLIVFVEWLLFSLGSKSIKTKRWSGKTDRYLYETFQLGRLQLHPFDYFAKLAYGFHGNPTSFFPTPQSICRMMAQMLFSGKDPTVSVMEPCAGTGSMLLEASNYSVNMYAQEICYEIVLMCEVNAYLYIPWLICPAPFLKHDRKKSKCFSL